MQKRIILINAAGLFIKYKQDLAGEKIGQRNMAID